MATIKTVSRNASEFISPGTIDIGRHSVSPLATIVYDADANTVDRKRLWNTELGDVTKSVKFLIDADNQSGTREIYLPPVGSNLAGVGYTVFIKNIGIESFIIKTDGGDLLTTIIAGDYYETVVVDNIGTWSSSTETPPSDYMTTIEVSRIPFSSGMTIPFKSTFVSTPQLITSLYYQPVTNAIFQDSLLVLSPSANGIIAHNSTITTNTPSTIATIDLSEAGDMGSERVYREFNEGDVTPLYGLREYIGLNDNTANIQYNRSTTEGSTFTNITGPGVLVSPTTGRFISVHVNESHNSISDGPFLYLLRENNAFLYISKGLDDQSHLVWYTHDLTASILRTICTLSIDLPDGNGPGDDMVGAYPSILYTQNLVTLFFRRGTAFDGSTIGSAVTVHSASPSSVAPQGLFKHSDYTIYALYNVVNDGTLYIRSSANNGDTWSSAVTVSSSGPFTSVDRCVQSIVLGNRVYVFHVTAAGTGIVYYISDDMSVGAWSGPNAIPCNGALNTLANYICVKYLVSSGRYVLLYYDVTAGVIKMIMSHDMVAWTNDITVLSATTNSGSLDISENNIGEIVVYYVTAAGALSRYYNFGAIEYTAME